MIITRTPLRISFAGGGSDLPAFFADEPGHVVSATIDKYVYISVNPHYGGGVRVSYARTENVDRASEVEHPIVRACLAHAGIRRGVEIVSVADVPSGTGLGSSSAFTVGLLAALAAYQGEFMTADLLAHTAYQIERGAGGQVGKQDQYAAAFGGLRAYTFHPDGAVAVETLTPHPEVLHDFESRLLLLDTGLRRGASALLADQAAAMRDSRRRATVRAMANLAGAFRDALHTGRLGECGDILDAAWRLKRNVTNGIAGDMIDRAYATAKQHGAQGGKLCGAGGGGFLLIYASPERHATIIKATGLRHLPIRLAPHGATVIYADTPKIPSAIRRTSEPSARIS